MQAFDLIIKYVIPILSFLGLSAFLSEIWKIKIAEKKRNSDENKKQELKKTENSIRQIVREELSEIHEKIKMIEDSVSLNKKADQALLRNRLYILYRQCHEKGFRTNEETVNWLNMYNIYHSLGSNGVMDNVKDDFFRISTDIQFDEEKGK